MVTSLTIEILLVKENKRVSDRLDELTKSKPPAAPAPKLPAPQPAPQK